MKENSDKLRFFLNLKLMFSKRHYQENEKANQRLKENVCQTLKCKGLLFTIHKEILKLNNKKMNTPFKT
jgi:hypothetical protein